MSMEVKSWTQRDVNKFLAILGFNSLIPAFQKHTVNGRKLITLTDNDLAFKMKCSTAQVSIAANSGSYYWGTDGPGAKKQ